MLQELQDSSFGASSLTRTTLQVPQEPNNTHSAYFNLCKPVQAIIHDVYSSLIDNDNELQWNLDAS